MPRFATLARIAGGFASIKTEPFADATPRQLECLLMFAFPCPICLATLKSPEERAGAHSKCPHCGCPVQVPAVVATTAANVQSTESQPRLGVPIQQPDKSRTKSGILILGGLFAGGVVLSCAGVLLVWLVVSNGWQKGRETTASALGQLFPTIGQGFFSLKQKERQRCTVFPCAPPSITVALMSGVSQKPLPAKSRH